VKALLEKTSMHVVATSRSQVTFQQNAKNLDSSRITFFQMDVTKESEIENVAKEVSEQFGRNLNCVINSAGYLLPEKSIKQVDFEQAKMHFLVNSIGPMLVAKHFSGLLTAKNAKWINMSARTGSIGDNSLGGWHSYRMSKAALNQLTKTLSVELGRKGASVVSLHPGTVDTDLSRPYVKNAPHLMTADESANLLMDIILNLKPEDNGTFLDFKKKPIVW
jgi:NAD(P)-dependent dehydrogenase (short-subunit alcohol dehydrogenase family)